MHGLLFEILEEWVTTEYGIESWQAIKKIAGSEVEDKSFLRRAHYQDGDFFDLFDAVSSFLKRSIADVIESYGRFCTTYLFANGYAELLRCQGSTLRQWLSNLNAMHDYIQRSFPGDKFMAPIFWCEDCDEVEGTIVLHYYSMRGNVLAPLVIGIVSELALQHFELEINMDQLALQGDDGAKFTSWRLSAVDESQRWKLSPSTSVMGNKAEEPAVTFEGVSIPAKCPFSGRTLKQGGTNKGEHANSPKPQEQKSQEVVLPLSCPFHHQSPQSHREQSESTAETCSLGTVSDSSKQENGFDFTVDHLNELFPFNIIIDQDFKIVHVGAKLPKVLQKTAEELCGSHIGDIVQITRPVLSSWDWKSLHKLSDQNFYLTPTSKTASLQHKVSMVDSILRFKAAKVRLSPNQVLFTLAPEARNVKELNLMGLTLSDLPLSGSQRDAVFLGEHVTQEANKAHKLDKLSKRLAIEKDLSNTLLNNMLPKKVAEELRRGKTVEPAFHENVTLFFSDIVGFTSICNQVGTWDVIDMMNQLYSVMDFLASHFDLYKVETVGDAYICCSGLPEPDEYHAEKVANFALAVLQCIKHVKSPVDGSPIQLRIGIHTGSCTSGLIGTLTPHYALFGDMVNTTSRHESTSIPGKIQISSLLYGRLEHFSKEDSPQYTFKARGLVDMKGKGEQYTYFLEGAAEGNAAVSAEALQALSRQVGMMLASNTWKKRRYFRKSGDFVEDPMDSSIGGSRCTSHGNSTESPMDDSNSVHSTGADLAGDMAEETDEAMPTAIIDFPQGKGLHPTQPWSSLVSEEEQSCEEAIFESLSASLASCVHKGGSRLEIMQDQLLAFVKRVANIYRDESGEKTLKHIEEVLLRSSFLWEARPTENNSSHDTLGASPWDQFVLLFSAFIHKVKHTGSSNADLVNQKHFVAQMYEGLRSCQQRRSVDFSFSLLEEDYGDLYDEITFGCPNFRSLVRRAVLCTDLECERTVYAMLSRCDKLNSLVGDERHARQRNDANIGLILAVATVGPYTQSKERFLQDCLDRFEEVTKLWSDKESHDYSESWYYEQSTFMKDIILPVIEEVLSVLPKATFLEEGAMDNISFWDQRGKEWIRACSLKNAKPDAPVAGKLPRHRVESLVSANAKILEGILAEVLTTRENGNEITSTELGGSADELNPYEDIALHIEMKKAPVHTKTNADGTHIVGPDVRSELRDLVVSIAAGYENNRFHNFVHASHVAHMANLLVKSIRPTEDSSGASDIAKDPLAQFAIVFSALVHDIGHSGVPNDQRLEEQPGLARKYHNKSIAEQNSIDTAWDIFMSKAFTKLHHSLFESRQERDRFRQLLVNCVMATDIFDPNLKVLRQERWTKALALEGSSDSVHEEEGKYMATIAIEHMMQVSDVAHTMQDWEIYRQWNESLFQEMYEAYVEGRSNKDPSKTWYDGELWFFDNWVIPLARNLKKCKLLDLASDRLVNEAKRNRQRWKDEGQDICEQMLSNYSAILESENSSVSSTSTAECLTAQIVSEVESLSKVMARYERKYESALGNLIAVAYKGQSFGEVLSKQDLLNVHRHFKQLDWYQLHVDGTTFNRNSNPAA